MEPWPCLSLTGREECASQAVHVLLICSALRSGGRNTVSSITCSKNISFSSSLAPHDCSEVHNANSLKCEISKLTSISLFQWKKWVQNTGFPGHRTVFDLGHSEVKLLGIFISGSGTWMMTNNEITADNASTDGGARRGSLGHTATAGRLCGTPAQQCTAPGDLVQLGGRAQDRLKPKASWYTSSSVIWSQLSFYVKFVWAFFSPGWQCGHCTVL